MSFDFETEKKDEISECDNEICAQVEEISEEVRKDMNEAANEDTCEETLTAQNKCSECDGCGMKNPEGFGEYEEDAWEDEHDSEHDCEIEHEEAESKKESVPVLKCTALTKSYRRRVKVLDNFNITVPQGKIVGLLGPNGCGKSTLMKLVVGILSPNRGTIEICGEERSERTNSYISYLPERNYFNSWMKVDSLIKYFKDFYPDFDERIARNLFSDLGINTKSKLRTLSKGTKEKVQLVMVMARRAKLYLLDEPIAGVDPAARDYIMRTIIGSCNPEATVIITTHLIYDIEPALDEFYFMAPGGKIVLSGSCDDVRAQHGKSLDQLFKEVFKC